MDPVTCSVVTGLQKHSVKQAVTLRLGGPEHQQCVLYRKYQFRFNARLPDNDSLELKAQQSISVLPVGAANRFISECSLLLKRTRVHFSDASFQLALHILYK